MNAMLLRPPHPAGSLAAPTTAAPQRSLLAAPPARRQGLSKAARGASAVPRAFSPALPAPAGGWSERGIFESAELPSIDNVTVFDARDALETCSGLFGDEKEACFSVFGVDSSHAETYYGVVAALEAALEWETDPEEAAVHLGQERC